VRADEVADFSILAPEQMDGWGIQVTSNREEIKRAKSTLREGQQEALPELRYKVEVNSPPELPEGPFSQDFSLLTDLPGAPRIQFRAQGVGHPDLVISPSALHFRLAKNQRKAVIQVRAITPAHTLGPPRAVVEGSSPELWNIQVLPVHEGHQYTLEVNYLGEGAPPDSPVLKVHLDHPEQSLASIPLRFLTTQSSN
ncbi:MAG: hypothetical protein MK213_03470, partial [Planctomycetes bacterium]|nr:hypothetical protein [Planctomycetota bacterium]